MAVVESDALLQGTMPRQVRWRRSELLEWALREASATFSLGMSAVPPVRSLDELPGGPYEIRLTGSSMSGHPEVFAHEDLRDSVAAHYGVDASRILIGRGAAEVDYLLAGAILHEGGTAIVETPTYQPILRAAESFADRVHRLPRRRAANFLPDPDDLRKLVNSETRLICLTNLHNPTGALIEQELLRELVEIGAEVGAQVLVDEVYLPMLNWEYRRHGHAAGAISVGSTDKTYGLSSLRIGWAIAPDAIVEKAYEFENLLGVALPFVTQDLAAQVLASDEAMAHFRAKTSKAHEGRKLYDDFLAANPAADCFRPVAGINGMVALPEGTDDLQFVEMLKAKRDTVAFPGGLFELPGTVRVSFGADQGMVREGLDRLGKELREW